MRAIQIDGHGGREALTFREVPDPVAGADEIVVRAVASSLNPIDWKTRAWDGMGDTFPVTLGWDLAGVVVSSNSGDFAVGDRVVALSAQIATGLGTWAESVVLPAELATAAPTTVSLPEAATLPLAGLTALQALAQMQLGSDERVLITGAVGGIGGIAVQLARRSGAAVDGLVSREAHVAEAKALGAEFVTHDPSQLPKGAYHAVLDTAGVHVNDAIADGGRYVSVADGDLPDIPNAAKSVTKVDNAGLVELVRLVDAGELRLRIAVHSPARQVQEAHELFERGGLAGKAVLLF